jgi:SAM-dependent methyltransferase
MNQTQVHDNHNPDLLSLIPKEVKKIIEVGSSSGALAREFKKIASDNHYLGLEIDQRYVSLSERYCDQVLLLDIEQADDNFWNDNADRDCWIFGDTLEHLRDPWKILKKIRSIIPTDGNIVACIPNVQHWSIQVKLNMGNFTYEDSGLLDRTHLRWFTRKTIIDMFDATDFRIVAGYPRIFNEPNKDKFLPIIEQLAKEAGGDPKVAREDALPLQYVLRAIPK